MTLHHLLAQMLINRADTLFNPPSSYNCIKCILVALQQGHTDIIEGSYKNRAHPDIIGNEGADACTRTAAVADLTGIAISGAGDPFHNLCWLSLKSSHGRNDDPRHSHTAQTHYLTIMTEKLENMHKRHKLGSADTSRVARSGYYYKSWKLTTHPLNLPTKKSTIQRSPLPTKEISHPNITLGHQLAY
eukprot:1157919-Pelagomonas_calceolata.AAC.11